MAALVTRLIAPSRTGNSETVRGPVELTTVNSLYNPDIFRTLLLKAIVKSHATGVRIQDH